MSTSMLSPLQFYTLSSPRANAAIAADFMPRPNRLRSKTRFLAQPSSSLTLHASLSDPFVLQIAETLEDSLPPPLLSPLQKLRDASSQSLISTSWPSRKDEPFRFTDTSFIRQSEIFPVLALPTLVGITQKGFESSSTETHFPQLLIIDGHVIGSVELADGVFIGALSSLPPGIIMKRVSEFLTNFKGDLFWSLNGVGAPDLLVVYVPANCRIDVPLYLRYYSNEGTDVGSKKLPISNPRVLVIVEEGGEIDMIEEHLGRKGDKCYWANSVTDVVIGKGAKVRHSYFQNQSLNAAHIKWTRIQQESASAYELIEVSTGGKLSRHNLHVQQVGPDTSTELSSFHLSLGGQTQDLHSRLILDHPRGYARQLHKCIVGHAQAQAVFDGNVKVNRLAQQTDAGQLTRSLLLEPRATVNVKPNLQIIADDVKCSHGAAISDLEENQLFYFLARGVDLDTARRALISSFAVEVIARFPHCLVQDGVEAHMKGLLERNLGGPS